jgi:hypothetical protein
MNLSFLQLVPGYVCLPLIPALVLSWVFIHKRLPLIGIVIGPIPIIILFLVVRAYLIYLTEELYRTGAPHPGITAEGYSLQIGFSLFCTIFDALIAIASGIIITAIYRSRSNTTSQKSIAQR